MLCFCVLLLSAARVPACLPLSAQARLPRHRRSHLCIPDSVMSRPPGRCPPPVQEGNGGGQRSIIEVTTDEAVGVALALGRQVYVSEDMWEGGRVSRNGACFN